MTNVMTVVQFLQVMFITYVKFNDVSGKQLN